MLVVARRAGARALGSAWGVRACSSVAHFQAQLNAACREYNSSYSANFVSWNDNSRQQDSCFGANITDARLKGKDGEDFLVVRSDNFNERIGRVRARDIALLVGNHDNTPLRPVTLADFLSRFGEFAAYAGDVPPNTSLACDRDVAVPVAPPPSPPHTAHNGTTMCTQVGIRFQAVFLPVCARQGAKREFFVDTFNYQTHSWSNPRNIVLLGTSQGTFVQQDGPGSVGQFLHRKSPVTSAWHTHYLEAMRTEHGVSMEQHESLSERQEALGQGKAVSTVIGTRAMGVGFNRVMTVQIPLKQQPRRTNPWWGPVPCSVPEPGQVFAAALCRTRASAARVSHGSQEGTLRGLQLPRYERDQDCSVTVTVQFYYTVPEGTQIQADDVVKAVEVCEKALQGCSWHGNLMDRDWDSAFAKKKMSAEDVANVSLPSHQNPIVGDNVKMFPDAVDGKNKAH